MKLRYIFGAAVSLFIGTTLTSCIDDDSTYGNPDSTPTLTVNGTAAGEQASVQVVNSYFGEEFVIDPLIEYSGSGELQYEWGISRSSRSEAVFEVVSHERVFRYMFPEGGAWAVQLKVTDGTVGFAQQYTAQVNRTFEAGYCVLSNNASGKGNLVFLKDMTPEEIDAGIEAKVVENILDVLCHDADDDELVGIKVLELTWPNRVRRISVSTTTHSYFLDPSSFTELSSIDYNEVIPGFKAKSYLGFTEECRAYDPAMKRYVTIKTADFIPCEDSEWKDYTFDAVFGGNYEANGNRVYQNYYINRSPLKVYNPYYYGYYWGCSDEIIYKGKPLFQNETLITAFMGEMYIEMIDYYGQTYPSEVYPAYFITTDGSRNYCTYLGGFGPYSLTPVELKSRVELPAGSIMPGPDTQIVASGKHHRTYYYNGNRVYVMLFLEDGSVVTPAESQWALQFPDDEEITFLGMDAESHPGDEVLIVATVTKSTGRGNVYLYDTRNVRTDNPGAKPTATYKNCADRIFEIMYKGRY